MSVPPVDVGVLIVPTDRDPSLRRTRREVTGPLFSRYFPLGLPLYVIEYDPETMAGKSGTEPAS